MIILAIDPGFDKIGYSLFDKDPALRQGYTYISSGLIKTRKGDTTENRLLALYDELEAQIIEHKPKKVIMEQLFLFKNQKTVIGVAQAQGAIMLLSAKYGLPLQFITPLQIKQIITGYGNSDKKAVHKMLSLLLKQEIVVQDDDQSDAIACGLAYCYINEKLIQ